MGKETGETRFLFSFNRFAGHKFSVRLNQVSLYFAKTEDFDAPPPSLFFDALVVVSLDEVGHVHRHLVDAGVVKLLNVVQRSLVLVGHEVDGDALAAETTAAANPESENLGLAF